MTTLLFAHMYEKRRTRVKVKYRRVEVRAWSDGTGRRERGPGRLSSSCNPMSMATLESELEE